MPTKEELKTKAHAKDLEAKKKEDEEAKKVPSQATAPTTTTKPTSDAESAPTTDKTIYRSVHHEGESG